MTLTDFRSYASASLDVSTGFVLLFGDNGAGKTNLLEAVSMLTPGRGLRGAALSDMARLGGSGAWATAATVPPPAHLAGQQERTVTRARESAKISDDHPTPLRAAAGSLSIGTGTLPSAPERRQVRINGAPCSVNSLSDWLAILWLTPAMDRLFAGTAGERRRFLDRLVLALEPAHAHHASRYEAAMRARNKLLAEEEWDETWLASLELAMAEHGEEIAGARTRTVAALDAQLATAPHDQFARAQIALEGWDSPDLATVLRENRRRDAGSGRATEGPHRQDLAVLHRAKQMPAGKSSTGEQKALLLGLVLAHAELVAQRRGEPPILLLDEVAAHLDPKRRAALFERLEGRGQVWMTATEETLFSGIAEAARFHVRQGQVTAV